MLNNDDPILFVATNNPELTKPFYEHVLGLKFLADEPFALVFDANGTMLRIFKVVEFTPARHTVLGWQVADIATRVDELTAKGVQFSRFEGIEQDDRGIWHSPSGARVAWFCDPVGNSLSLTQF